MSNKPRYTSADFPPLPKGIWWEEARQRFRIRLYSRKRVFRAPYASVRSAGSIEGALNVAMNAYHTILQEVDNHNAKFRVQPDLTKPSGLLQSIGRAATSIKVKTHGNVPNPTRVARNHWSITPKAPDRRFR